MKEERTAYGATVERGRIAERRQTDTGFAYTVESFDRPGVVGYNMKKITLPDAAAGDTVFFFLFDDGTGMIL